MALTAHDKAVGKMLIKRDHLYGILAPNIDRLIEMTEEWDALGTCEPRNDADKELMQVCISVATSELLSNEYENLKLQNAMENNDKES